MTSERSTADIHADSYASVISDLCRVDGLTGKDVILHEGRCLVMIDPPLKPARLARKIRKLTVAHSEYRTKCLNMNPAENVTSQAIRSIVSSDLMHRYATYEPGIESRWEEGTKYVVEIERIVQELCKNLFDSQYVELRAVSGQVADFVAIAAFAKPNSGVFETSQANGGHGWHHICKDLPVLNYRSDFFPFDSTEWNVNLDATLKKIRQERPSVLVLGSSYYLFPYPVKELRAAADEVGAVVISDESHVLGLIAGKQWPNPLKEGAHVLLGSTHKSLPGPQRGIILTNDPTCANTIASRIFATLVANHHPMDVAALGYCMAEMLRYGESYAAQVVKNARTFGEALSDEGFDVVGEGKGFTQSHQVLIRTDKFIPAAEAIHLLAKANIIVNKMELTGANGLRTGTAELTRIGMKERDMKEIAAFYRKIIIEKKNPANVAKKVSSYRSKFRKIHYTFG